MRFFLILCSSLLLLLTGCDDPPLNDYVPYGADFVGGTDGVGSPSAASGILETIEQLTLRQGIFFPVGRFFSEAGITPERMGNHFLVYASIEESPRAGVLIRLPAGTSSKVLEELRSLGDGAETSQETASGALSLHVDEVEVRIAAIGDSLLAAVVGDWPIPAEAKQRNSFALDCRFNADSVIAFYDSSRQKSSPPLLAPRKLVLHWHTSEGKTVSTFSADYATAADAAAMENYFQKMFATPGVVEGVTLEFQGGPAEAVQLLPPGERRLRQLETVARARELLRETLRQAELHNGTFPDDILESLVGQMTAPAEVSRPFLARKYGGILYLGRGAGTGRLKDDSRLPVLLGKPWEASGGLLAVGFADGRVEEMPLRAPNCRSAVQLLRVRSDEPVAPVWITLLKNAFQIDQTAGF